MNSNRYASFPNWLFVVLIVGATGSAAFAQTLPIKEPRLTEEQGRQKLAEFASTWHTREQWEQRAKNISPRCPPGAI
jgi:hypothetical protein